MELWIRSQKKDKLFKINGLDITKMNDNSYEITGYTTYDIYLGRYKTKERALEVLDEIQKLLEPKIIYKVDDKNPKQYFIDGNIVINNDIKTEIKEFKTIVYEMPQE